MLEEPQAQDDFVRLGDVVDGGGGRSADPEPAPAGGEPEEEGTPPLNPVHAAGVAFLSTAAAGWMLGGAFDGLQARFVAVGAALLGALIVFISHKTRTPALFQILTVPAALALAAVLAAKDLPGGAGDMFSAAKAAADAGGLGEPPVAFAPGWRIILVGVVTLIAVAAASGAMLLKRAQIAVVVPGVLMVAGVMVQPRGSEMTSVLVSLGLLAGGLALSYGAHLAQQGVTGGGFEIRRFAKAAAFGAVVLAVIIPLGNSGALLPAEQEAEKSPSVKPLPPAGKVDPEKEIFTVSGKVTGPVRLGVFDVYRSNGWMTPPFDSSRLTGTGGEIPGVTQTGGGERNTVTVTVKGLDGRALPEFLGTVKVNGGGAKYDPRTQTLRGPVTTKPGTSYTLETVKQPSTDEILAADGAVDPKVKEFTEAPQVPFGVQDLLLKGGADALPPQKKFAKLREELYAKAVAKGGGNPVDVSPDRVVELLGGADATPYELVAAETLLARWAGLPARIGYGYQGGEKNGDLTVFRPRHGAMWVETYVPGHGWAAIVSKPKNAQSTLSGNQQDTDTAIQATDGIAAQLYLPVRMQNPKLVYVTAQYWAERLLPWAALLVLVGLAYPGLLKAFRRRVRRRWARRIGPRAEVAVAYAELRDYANDLNIGHPTMTPVEFLDAVEPDPVHTELAWLVTRVMWGDLIRDTTEKDAKAAAVMAKGLRKRLGTGQAFNQRVLGYASRVSLRSPYAEDLPNTWVTLPGAELLTVGGFSKGSGKRALASARVSVRRTWRRMRQQGRAWRPAWRKPTQAEVARTGIRAFVLAASVALFTSLIVTGGIQDVDLSVKAKGNQREIKLPEAPGELKLLAEAPKPVAPGSDVKKADAGPPAQPVGTAAAPAPAANLGTVIGLARDTATEASYRGDDTTLVGDGRFYVLSRDTVAIGTLQVGGFKPNVADKGDEVRDGLMKLGNGNWATSRINGEKVQVQKGGMVTFVLWVSPDNRFYQLITVKKDFELGDQLMTALITYNRTGSTEPSVMIGSAPTDPRRGAL